MNNKQCMINVNSKEQIMNLYSVRQNACSSRSLRPMHKTKICHNVTISTRLKTNVYIWNLFCEKDVTCLPPYTLLQKQVPNINIGLKTCLMSICNN